MGRLPKHRIGSDQILQILSTALPALHIWSALVVPGDHQRYKNAGI